MKTNRRRERRQNVSYVLNHQSVLSIPKCIGRVDYVIFYDIKARLFDVEAEGGKMLVKVRKRKQEELFSL